jgi:hypothetical protein
MSMLLSRETILSADDITVERCEVPEWGGHVFVKTMTARAKERWEQDRMEEREKKTNSMSVVRASLAAATVCDEQGTLLFTPADIDALNAKSVKPLDRIFAAATKLNRINDGDLEELVKNSEPTPDDDSPSA